MAETAPEQPNRRSAVVGALTLVGGLVAVALLYRVLGATANILKLFILAFLIALGLHPAVNALTRRRIPRVLAVLGPLLLVAVALVVLGIIFIPPAATQAGELVRLLPDYGGDLGARVLRWVHHYPWIEDRLRHVNITEELARRAGSLTDLAGVVAAGVANAAVSAALVAFAVIFMLLQPEPLRRGVLGLFPDRHAERAHHVIRQLVTKLRAWIQGMVILMVLVALLDFAGLTIFGVPYAALFALLAGLLELIPTVGPVLAAVGPVLVGLATSPLMALEAAAVFLVVQQLEGNILVPLIMSRKLSLHPVSVFFGFLVMASLFGLFGAVIAVPVVACAKVLYEELYTPWAHPNQKPTDEESPPKRRRRRARPPEPEPPPGPQGHE